MSLILSKFLPYIVGVLGIVAGLLSLYFKGRKDANLKRDNNERKIVIDKIKDGQKLQDKLDKQTEKIHEKIENTPDDSLPDILSDILSSGYPKNPPSK